MSVTLHGVGLVSSQTLCISRFHFFVSGYSSVVHSVVSKSEALSVGRPSVQVSMASETDATTKGYHLDEQTFTHIVAAHLDQQSDETDVHQTSTDSLLVVCNHDATIGMVNTALRVALEEQYGHWNPTTEQISDTRVRRVELDYEFEVESDAGMNRMNAIRERTSELLATLLDDDPGAVEFTAESDIMFESTTAWPALIDLQEKLTRPRLNQLRDVGLSITCIDPQAERIPDDATRVFVESDGLYQIQ